MPFRHPLGLSLLLALPTLALASPYSQLVIFGDSLSDSGQFPDLLGPLDGVQPIGGLRMTNRTGPTYRDNQDEPYAAVAPQYLAQRLGLAALPSTPALQDNDNPDGTNYAVAGYRTDDILASIIEPDGSVVARSGVTLRERDGYLVGTPKVDPDTLFLLNGGGNDLFQGRVVDAASAGVAAADLVAGVAALRQAGARHIIVSDLPDVGLTPAGAASGDRALWSSLSTAFNDALRNQLAALDSSVILLNVRGLVAEVVADPARYGFDPAVVQTDVCFVGYQCNMDPTWGITGATADPARLMFFDGVHPTTAVHAINADYIHSILAAPWEISLLPEIALGGLMSHQQQLRHEWQSARGDWQRRGDWHTFVAATGHSRDFEPGVGVSEADNDGLGITLGSSYRLADAWRWGFSLGLQDQRLETPSDSSYKLDAYLLSTFLQYQRSRLWADVGLSYGKLEYRDLERHFAMGISERVEKGETDGAIGGASLRLGYALGRKGRWSLSPFISAEYARVDMDAWRERGDSSTALRYADQTRDSKRAGVGIEARIGIGRRSELFGEVAREREFEDEAQVVDMGLVSVPGFDYGLQGYTPHRDHTLATLGVATEIGQAFQVRLAYQLRDAEERQHGANLSLTWGF